MLYQSTRGEKKHISAAEAIVRGLSGDGGLYAPVTFPSLTPGIISNLIDKPYSKRASAVLSMFLGDFGCDELDAFATAAYKMPGFDHPDISPLHKIDNSTYFIELWHGPTAAFKDMALQIMPYLLTASLKKTGEQREVCILVATSGDTGKAALEGFCNVPGTRIMVFYPKDGVSVIQKLQMTSQRGNNVSVIAVHGNFDDTQSAVKDIFADNELAVRLDKQGIFLSSANSINWGRLVPQIAYYISAYCDMLASGGISPGDKINFCVPTGNFGNILAAYYACKMGLPVGRLICASNRNDVLTQFINTGVYNKNRAFYTTVSPSMDILVSSNLERLLYELSGKDGGIVSSYMSELSATGQYAVSAPLLDKIRQIFAPGFCSEEDTIDMIAAIWKSDSYLIDPHTAVACKALRDYRAMTGDTAAAVVVSTASPFKFSESVLEALKQPVPAGGIGAINALSQYTGIDVPASLAGLAEQKERFSMATDAAGMKSAVTAFLLKDSS